MKFPITLFVLLTVALSGRAQEQTKSSLVPGYESRIRNYVDSLRVIDTHEHLFTPEIIEGSYFLDFMLLFQPNGYDNLKSAGMPDSHFNSLPDFDTGTPSLINQRDLLISFAPLSAK